MKIVKGYSLICCICTLFFFQSCSQKNEHNQSQTIIISPEKENSPTEVFDKVFKEVSFVALETNDNCLITKCDQLHVGDENIFILDNFQKKIFRFNLSGDFINDIGNKGKGPGEFLNPSYFSVSKENKIIKVYDRRLKKVTELNFNGQLISEKRVDIYFQSFYQVSQDKYWAFTTNDGNKLDNENEINFVEFNNSGKIQKIVRGVENPNILFCNGGHFSKQNSLKETSFVLPLHRNIYSFDDNSQVAVKYKLNFKNGNIPAKQIKKIFSGERKDRKNNQKIFDELRKKYAYGYTQFVEFDNWIYLEYFHQKKGRGVFYNISENLATDFSKTPYEKNSWKTLFPVNYGRNNCLYSVVNPVALKRLLNGKNSNYSQDRIESIKAIQNAIPETNNPIIIKYEI